MRNVSFAVLGLLICFSFCAPFASAHSLGASFEKETEGLVIDVGYEPAEPTTGAYVRFDFELWETTERTARHDYEYVWARILREDRTVFAAGIYRQNLGPTTLLYTFAEPGKYTLAVSYRNDDGELVRAEFPFSVAEASADSWVGLNVPTGVAFAFLVMLLFFLWFVLARVRHGRSYVQ